MHLNDEPLSLYDVLELTPDATPQEIRSAYLRLKSSYSKDNIAHYTVFSREETEAMLQSIENAYMTLSNPESRRNYDQNQGSSIEIPALTSTSFSNSSPVSPMQNFSEPQVNELDSIIKNEQEWNGAAIRRIREARRISIEDLADFTRISRTYLLALEEDDFKKLPAQVYVRGFLQQISRRLKLPADFVAQNYIARLKIARPDK
jgi:flagellar biosynthesis protein FlhG